MSKHTSALLLAGAVTLLAGCGRHHGKKPRLADLDHAPRLETIAPERRPTFTVRREYTATVEPLEKADLYAQVRGVVQYLSPDVDIGRFVRGESVSAPAVASALGLLGREPLLAAGVLLGGRAEAEVLVQLAIPDVVAERDNKRALLALALEARGQAVKAREVAAREVKEAEAQRKRYHAEVEFRAIQHQRMVRLVSSDTVQRQQAEEARLMHKSALAAFEAAEAQMLTKEARLHAAEGDIAVAQAKVRVARAELDKLEAMVAFATIRAPFDGIVTRRWVNRGDTVKDFGNPLLSVVRTDVVRVLIDVPERDAPYLRASANNPAGGNSVILTVPVLRDRVSGGAFAGQVTLTSGALDPVTRTMRTEIWLPNRGGHLRPQMTGTAAVVLEERKDVFTVPSSAIVRQGDKAAVFCVVNAKGDPPRGVVRHIDVEVGVDDGRVAEIRRGLTGNERIITKGNGVVQEGDFAIAVPAR